MLKKIKCPCCGYFTIESDDEVIVEICEVCFWQYDLASHMNSKEISGANSQSLDSARKNYSLFQACDKAYINNVRKPLFEEFPKNNLE